MCSVNDTNLCIAICIFFLRFSLSPRSTSRTIFSQFPIFLVLIMKIIVFSPECAPSDRKQTLLDPTNITFDLSFLLCLLCSRCSRINHHCWPHLCFRQGSTGGFFQSRDRRAWIHHTQVHCLPSSITCGKNFLANLLRK